MAIRIEFEKKDNTWLIKELDKLTAWALCKVLKPRLNDYNKSELIDIVLDTSDKEKLLNLASKIY